MLISTGLFSSLLPQSHDQLLDDLDLKALSSRAPLQPPPADPNRTYLGRVLFYDKTLSRNDSIACASCHQQEFAFSDTARFSIGLDGQPTLRNSMAAFNTAFHVGGFFWDLRASTLEEQVLIPIQDPLEMDMNLTDLNRKLAQTSYYPNLFSLAFGDTTITSERIATALTTFLRQIVSNRSRYDQGVANQFADFTDEERLGLDLFTRFADPNAAPRGANCFLCHSHVINFSAPSFAGFASNGLDTFPDDDGVGAISGQNEHLGTFKIPTLRNIMLTAPYMHDGRFATIEEVIDHYDSGLQPHVNLDPILRDLGNVRPGFLDLTQEERSALVAFLKTFTDSALISDPAYGDPFVQTSLDPLKAKQTPEDFQLHQNYPNPFNPSTTIPFNLTKAANIRLDIFDINGRLVQTLVEDHLPAGNYRAKWDTQELKDSPIASGIFVYTLSINRKGDRTVRRSKKMILLK